MEELVCLVLGIEWDSGVFNTNKELMPLRDQNDPIVMIRKQEGKIERETWIKDDEVVVDEDGGHISCDLASTWI